MRSKSQAAARARAEAGGSRRRKSNVTPTDERAFYEKVQRVTAFRSLRGLRIPADVIAELGHGNAEAAVAALSGAASQGNNEANIALVHVQHWCSAIGAQRPGDPKVQIAKLVKDQPRTARRARCRRDLRRARLHAARARRAAARRDSTTPGIEARLRAAAAAGDPASATELAQFLRDPAKREAMLQSAVEKNYPPAVYKVATNLLIAVQRGQTTENVEPDPRAAQDRGPHDPESEARSRELHGSRLRRPSRRCAHRARLRHRCRPRRRADGVRVDGAHAVGRTHARGRSYSPGNTSATG